MLTLLTFPKREQQIISYSCIGRQEQSGRFCDVLGKFCNYDVWRFVFGGVFSEGRLHVFLKRFIFFLLEFFRNGYVGTAPVKSAYFTMGYYAFLWTALSIFPECSCLLSFIMFYCGYGVQIGVNVVIEFGLMFDQLRFIRLLINWICKLIRMVLFRTNLKYESQKHWHISISCILFEIRTV